MHQSRFAFSYGRLHFPHEKCLLLKTRIYEKLNQLKPVQFGAGMMVRLLAALPQSVVGAILTKALNDALAELLLDGEFEFLSEKICEIYFSDLSYSWLISYRQERLAVLSAGVADVRISATVSGFTKLVSQSCDPDTLFFDRELLIEGDTALGLQIKNLLDTLDDDQLSTFWRYLIVFVRRAIKFELQAV